MSLSTRELSYFQPTCPSGGSWFACTGGSFFVGCCASDPCSNGCSDGNVAPVSFNASTYSTFPDASCGAASRFYSCVRPDQQATFWGCCKSNPCNEYRCADGDLVPAFMARPEQFSAYATSVPSSLAATATNSGTSTTASATGVVNGPGPQQTSHTAVIVGGVVGGVLGLAIIIALLIFFLCRRKKSRNEDDVYPEGLPKAEKYEYRASALTEAPPQYSSPNPSKYPPSPTHSHAGAYYHQIPTEPQAQELPATSLQPPVSTQRYSELPADVGAMRVAELESPGQSPRLNQSPGFASHSPPRRGTGLGL